MWLLNDANRKLSLPDWLSIYRILAAPALVILLFTEERSLFGLFILISFVSDRLDGFFARKMKIVSRRGAQLDSIGDALTVVIGLAGVVKFETAFVQQHLLVILMTLVLYLFQLFMAYVRYGMPSSFHTYLSKLAALLQAVFMVTLFFSGSELWLFYLAMGFSMVGIIEEILLVLFLPTWMSDVRGLLWMLNRQTL